MCVCFQIESVFDPAKSDRKKGNFCPSPVSDINTTDDNPDMWCTVLLHSSIKQVLSQLARGWRGGPDPELESQGVETAKHASNSPVEQLH